MKFKHYGQSFEVPNQDYAVAGYEHSGGVEALDGTKYWMVAICPECGYQLTLKHKEFFTGIDYEMSKFFNG